MAIIELGRYEGANDPGFAKPLEIVARFEKDDLPYHFKIYKDTAGWLFAFYYGTPEGMLVLRGDGTPYIDWVQALQGAVEYVKINFHFKDVIITGLQGTEYVAPRPENVGRVRLPTVKI